jgi:hypothetical protein
MLIHFLTTFKLLSVQFRLRGALSYFLWRTQIHYTSVDRRPTYMNRSSLVLLFKSCCAISESYPKYINNWGSTRLSLVCLSLNGHRIPWALHLILRHSLIFVRPTYLSAVISAASSGKEIFICVSTLAAFVLYFCTHFYIVRAFRIRLFFIIFFQ